MGERDLRVEATGETVGEAKWNALRELERVHPGLDRTVVQFEVVSEGERGLLGVGYAPARVVAVAPAAAEVTQPAVASREDSDVAAHARELVERIADAMLVSRPRVPIDVTLTPIASVIASAVAGEDVGLIGPLMESLESDLLPRDDAAAGAFGVRLHGFDAAVERALRDWEAHEPLGAR